MTGIKFVLQATGRAYGLTLNAIILNISSAVSLTTITPRIVDFLMLWVMPNRKEYRKLKYVRTKDLDEEEAPSRRRRDNNDREDREDRLDREEGEGENHFVEGPP